MDIATTDRFWSKVSKTPEGCWKWTGSHSASGYGYFWAGGKNLRAHRVSYQMCVGPIPADLQLDHLCRVRDCVNPEHLEAVTASVNVQRGLSPLVSGSWHRVKDSCPRDHPYTDENTYRHNGRRFCRACWKFHREKQKEKV